MARASESAPRLIDNRKRIALTAEALEALKAKPGDFLVVVVDGSDVRLKRIEWVVK